MPGNDPSSDVVLLVLAAAYSTSGSAHLVVVSILRATEASTGGFKMFYELSITSLDYLFKRIHDSVRG
jgi:hypothetical protein